MIPVLLKISTIHWAFIAGATSGKSSSASRNRSALVAVGATCLLLSEPVVGLRCTLVPHGFHAGPPRVLARGGFFHLYNTVV